MQEEKTMMFQCDGKNFEVNTFPGVTLWEALAKREWEAATLDVMDYFLTESGTMIDLGCSYGPFTLYGACVCSLVYAFDPDPIMFEKLKANLQLNPPLQNRIKASNIAIAPENKTYKLSAREKYGKSTSSLLSRVLDEENSYEIVGMTFKRFVEEEKIEKLDLIKMDIEGGEFLILPSMFSSLAKLAYPPIYISFHPMHLSEQLVSQSITSKKAGVLFYKIKRKLKLKNRGKNFTNLVNDVLGYFENYKYWYYESRSIELAELVEILQLSYEPIEVLFANRPYIG